MKVLDNMEIRNCGQCKFGKNATINDVQYYQLTCSGDRQYPLYCFYPNSERPEGMMYGVYDHELLPNWCPLPDKEVKEPKTNPKVERCKWKKWDTYNSLYSTCVGSNFLERKNDLKKYCPYCGKEIQWEE